MRRKSEKATISTATNGPAHCIFSIFFDSKTGGQQHISVDTHGHSIGLWSGRWTLLDAKKGEMPMERFEPSTLAGLVFETSAYTVPPHRPVKRVHAIQPNHKNHRNKRKTLLTKRSIPYLVKACNQRKRRS